jgi:HlyD family secretion protein
MGNFATWRATKIRGDFDLKTFEVRAIPVEHIDGLRAGMTAVVDWNKVKRTKN